MFDNFLTLILILTPLIVGFLVPLPKHLLVYIDNVLSKLVFVILAFIGVSLSHVQNLGSQIDFILLNVLILASCCIGFGLLGLMIFDKYYPLQRKIVDKKQQNSVSVKGSLLQMACVAIGFFCGKILPTEQLPIDNIIKGLLMLLILLVGFQLSNAGMTLREVLLNKRGVQVSVIFCVSVAIGGILFSFIVPDVTLTQGLALSSGYGWYSLSGIIMTDAYGAVWGSVALLNDLLREFVALLFIPFFMRKFPSASVGLGGATSMDFTLPVIQGAGGNEIVPLAMSFGFVVNVVSPILMVIFSSFA